MIRAASAHARRRSAAASVAISVRSTAAARSVGVPSCTAPASRPIDPCGLARGAATGSRRSAPRRATRTAAAALTTACRGPRETARGGPTASTSAPRGRVSVRPVARAAAAGARPVLLLGGAVTACVDARAASPVDVGSPVPAVASAAGTPVSSGARWGACGTTICVVVAGDASGVSADGACDCGWEGASAGADAGAWEGCGASLPLGAGAGRGVSCGAGACGAGAEA
jgi:hypothetical protein